MELRVEIAPGPAPTHSYTVWNGDTVVRFPDGKLYVLTSGDTICHARPLASMAEADTRFGPYGEFRFATLKGREARAVVAARLEEALKDFWGQWAYHFDLADKAEVVAGDLRVPYTECDLDGQLRRDEVLEAIASNPSVSIRVEAPESAERFWVRYATEVAARRSRRTRFHSAE